MNGISEAAWLWLAKAAGAVAGSAISLAYLLPPGRREAAIPLPWALPAGSSSAAPWG